MKHTKSTLDKLEQLLREQDYSVRYEKGNFNSGYCIVEQSKIIVVNKFFDTAGRINILLDILSTILVMEESLSASSLQFFKQILRSEEFQLKS